MKTKKAAQDLETNLKILEWIREKKELTKEEFAVTELGIPYRTYLRWVNGHNEPSSKNIQLIEKYIDEYPEEIPSPVAFNVGTGIETSSEVLVEKLVWIRLPKKTWEELEKIEEEKGEGIASQALKEFAEREKVKD